MTIAARMRALKRELGRLARLPRPLARVLLRRRAERASTRDARLSRALASATGRLVFVCHGNIMRSAFATEYARQLAPELATRIVGAGTHATNGRAAQDSAIRVAHEFAVPLGQHHARALADLHLDGSDLVVCMDRANEAFVVHHYPLLADRTFLVGVSEVADPYGRGDDATRGAFTEIARLTGQWLARFRGVSQVSKHAAHDV